MITLKQRMANHGVGRTLGVGAPFGTPVFLSIVEGGLAWAPTPIQPLHPIGLDIAIEALEKLQVACSEGLRP
jgi:hypothetical protein